MSYQCHKPSPSTYRRSLATSANPNRTAPCKVTPPSELFVGCKYPVKKTRSIYILNPTVIGVMFTTTNYYQLWFITHINHLHMVYSLFFHHVTRPQTPRTPRSFPPGQAKTLLPALRLEPGRLCREGRWRWRWPGGWPVVCGLENYPLGICYITSIYKGFSMAMLNNQRVYIYTYDH